MTFAVAYTPHSTVTQLQTIYLAEKQGSLSNFMRAYHAQTRYADAYYRSIELYSAQDNFEGQVLKVWLCSD